MRLRTYRDQQRSRHFDLVGDHWAIDLVVVAAAVILIAVSSVPPWPFGLAKLLWNAPRGAIGALRTVF
jgi:hypothetical protein